MRARLGFLETAVARRMLAHFLLASALPALLVSVAGIWYVRNTLERETEDRVARSAKAASLVLMGRLAARTAELAPEYADNAATWGLPTSPRPIAEAARASGVLIRVDVTDPAADAQIRLVRFSDAPVPAGSAVRDSVIVRLQNDYFWSPIDELLESELAEYCLFVVESWQRVRCSPGLPLASVAFLRDLARTDSDGSVRVLGDSLIGAQNDLYLRDAFGTASWRLIVLEPTEDLQASNRRFTVTLVILFALGLVTAFALAHRQIRVSTEPLRVLRDATRRIQSGDLETTVSIGSGDEFRELGEALNSMSTALGEQVRVLRDLDSIDAVALEERDAARIADRGVRALCATEEWAEAAIAYRALAPSVFTVTTLRRSWDAPRQTVRQIAEHEQARLLSFVSAAKPRSSQSTRASSLRIPVIHAGVLLGVIDLEADSRHRDAGDESWAASVQSAHRLADRVALALGNVHLFERLEALSAGTIRAFARTIDANSPWTAGHSERVTHLALAIGRQLELDDAQLGQLYRGGLLHDIGKVAVPPEVLDKPGRLTPEEREIVERHPGVGFDILSPIPGFADILPIVRSHHERIDGTGYPDRLAGDAIPYLARVLAVADVYDALTSDRPYRAGMTRQKAIGIMQEGAGTWLDADVLAAFVALGYEVAAFDVPAALATESNALEQSRQAVPM